MLTHSLFIALALTQPHPSDLARRGGVRVNVGVGVGFDFGTFYIGRHCRGYDPSLSLYAPIYPVYAPPPIYVQPPVYIERQQVVVTPPPAVVPLPPVEKKVYVEKPVERVVYVDRTVYIENGKTTMIEKVDGKVKAITHAPSEPQKLDDNKELELLSTIRDEINKKMPLDVASIVTSGKNKTVEVILRATKYAPYDRVTRRYEISASTLTLVSQDDLVIHFNADPEGVSDLADDFQDLFLKMGNECLAQGGEWYLDNHFKEDPKKENSRPLKATMEDLDAKLKK